VKAVNDALEDEPERVNNSPYEDGWMVRLEMSDASQLDALMDADAYKQFIQDKD
jgi:glycine cleavage system H protein